MPKPRRFVEDRGISYERSAYFGLYLHSNSVALVRHAGGRSTPLPTWCDVCEKVISDYPFIAKNNVREKYHLERRRRYHLACALNIGLVSLIPVKA